MTAYSDFNAGSPCRRPLNARPPGAHTRSAARRLLPSTYYCLLPITYCTLLALGCSGPKPDSGDGGAEKPLVGVELRVAVVDDRPLADAVGRLSGEWNSLTGGVVRVESITEEELDAAERLRHDAVICAAHRLGPLVQRGLTAPMPKELLAGNAGDWSDVFELVRLRVACWGREVFGVPLGSPVLTCYYRADLLQKLGRPPPRSWAEYQELAEQLASLPQGGDLDAEGWCGTVEPLAPGWAGLVLIARAAPYAKHRDNYSTLFDIQTMEPLVSGPPFVRALQELVAAAEAGPKRPQDYDPAAARAAFWRGNCGMVLSWPTSADSVRAAAEIPVGFVELPGSSEVFEIGSRQWETRAEGERGHVPLTGLAGRIGVVGNQSGHRPAAFQLLLWLSGKQLSGRVCTHSRATTLFRRSHVETAGRWTEGPISSSAARQYADVTAATLGQRTWLSAPRIPGRSEYLSALDAAVHQAVSGEKAASEALQEAATRWREITKRRGLHSQKAAYHRSLGLGWGATF